MRLFLAIDLPAPLRERLAGTQERLRERLEGWRWVRVQGIHLTLRFLGEVGEEADARARERWRGAARECVPLRIGFGGLGLFPPRGSARVLWAGVRECEPAEGLSRLGVRIEAAAREAGFRPEPRPFHPHLTLARADRRGRPDKPPEGLVGEIGALHAEEIVLFRSELSAGGARYTALDRFALGP